MRRRQDKPQQPAELAEANLLVVGNVSIDTMHHNEVERGDYHRILTTGTRGEERPFRQSHRRRWGGRVEEVSPPQITIAEPKTGPRIGLDAVVHPLRRDDLPVLPASVMEVEQREASQVAGA